MKVFLNDQEEKIDIGENLHSFMEKKKLSQQNGIAVALNNAVIPKSEWIELLLSDGDKITVIMATAGG